MSRKFPLSLALFATLPALLTLSCSLSPDVRIGERQLLATVDFEAGWRDPIQFEYALPDDQDWALLLERP